MNSGVIQKLSKREMHSCDLEIYDKGETATALIQIIAVVTNENRRCRSISGRGDTKKGDSATTERNFGLSSPGNILPIPSTCRKV